jgi:gas vesicle protein
MSSSTTKFLAGFVIGGAIGAIAGILLAPKSGAETREELARNARECAERTKQTVKEIQSKADNVVADLQKKGEEIKGQLEKMLKKKD